MTNLKRPQECMCNKFSQEPVIVVWAPGSAQIQLGISLSNEAVAVPIDIDHESNLSRNIDAEVIHLYKEAVDEQKLSNAPPVLPKEGQLNSFLTLVQTNLCGNTKRKS